MKGNDVPGGSVEGEPEPLINDAIVRLQNELSATVFAAMVLFAVVKVAIFLATLRATLWTGISDDHR